MSTKKKPNIWVVLGIGLGVIGLGVVIYFIFFHTSKKPPPPPTKCDDPNVATDCGTAKCCGTGLDSCCNGQCYSSKDHACVSGKICALKKVCTKDGKSMCCKEDEECDSTSGKCIACTTDNPPCEGQKSSGTPPQCCGAKDNPCHIEGEDSKANPCVCCPTEDADPDLPGYGGTCCSQNRCRSTNYAGKKLANSVCCPATDDVVDVSGKKCCNILDIDLDGSCSGKDWQLQHCGTLNKDGTVSIAGTCDTDGEACAVPSVCYSEFPKIASGSPLAGMCTGQGQTAQVCVNQKDYGNSTFAACPDSKCSDSSETCTPINYTTLPAPSGGKCVGKKCGPGSQNAGKECNGDKDCGGVAQESLRCDKLHPCTGSAPPPVSEACIKITDAKFKGGKIVYTGQYVGADPKTGECPSGAVKNGTCLIGCPESAPTTWCQEGQVCNESTTSKGTVGYCSTKGDQRPSPSYTLGTQPLDTLPVDKAGNSLDVTLDQCKTWCEPGGAANRGGRCVLTENNGKNVWACRVSACAEAGKNGELIANSPMHFVEGNTLSDGATQLLAQLKQTYSTPPGAGQCYKDGAYYGATDISYVQEDEQGATCTTTFGCQGPKRSGILMSSNATSTADTGGCCSQQGKDGMIGSTQFGRSGADLTMCNTCVSDKCSISGESCKKDTDCSVDIYATHKDPDSRLPCPWTIGNTADGLFQHLDLTDYNQSLCTKAVTTKSPPPYHQWAGEGDNQGAPLRDLDNAGAFCLGNNTQCGGSQNIDGTPLCQGSDFIGI